MIFNNKVCPKCKKEKPLSDFTKHKSTKDGYAKKCRGCVKDYRCENIDVISKAERKSQKKNRVLRNRRTNAHNHGMTLEEYDNFFVNHNYQCEVCDLSQEKSFELFGMDLHIDHSHKTGEVKGLLCCLCNPAAGHLKDNPDLAFRLWRYLERTRRKEN